MFEESRAKIGDIINAVRDRDKENTPEKKEDTKDVLPPSAKEKNKERPCKRCGAPILGRVVKANYYVCPKCDGYYRVHAYRRVEMILDEGSFEEWDADMPIQDPLDFPDYPAKVAEVREQTKLNEAVVTGCGKIYGHETVFAVCDNRYLMSSMGHNMGEKIARAVERATEERLPVIIYASSGGARMQEGMISLMQMAKTAAALKRHSEAGLLFISFLTEPTTGGVTASFAMLGDIILAEPGALIGFAGPRVIEQTIHQKLPEGFQRAEFQQEHGFVDQIVERRDQKEVLARLLEYHNEEHSWKEWPAGDEEEDNNNGANLFAGAPFRLSPGMDSVPKSRKAPFSGTMQQKTLDQIDRRRKMAWDVVRESRSVGRPTAREYINVLFDDFQEFHGDRYYGDDGAVIGGIASFHGMPVTVIGQERGRDSQESIERNFGMPSPEGYRKALRLMKQAEKFMRPIVCFVDTSGAYPGMEAEERGQGEAIAKNLFEMSSLKVPVLSIVTGQGGSGGALALAVANEVWMLENATYSILSPEGFASILWKDSKKANEAAGLMKITAEDLYELGTIERIIPEEEPATEENLQGIAELIDHYMRKFFAGCASKTPDELVDQRYDRFRGF